MKKIILFIIFIINVSLVNSQTTVEQKLAVIKNDGVIGGDFFVTYSVKMTNPPSANTLGSATADIVYDSSSLVYVTGTNLAFNYAQGYMRDLNPVTVSDSSKTKKGVRINVTGMAVNANGNGDPPGFDITSNYIVWAQLNFRIISYQSTTMYVKHNGNQIGLFQNYQNAPNTGVIISQTLSAPINIIDQPLPVSLNNFRFATNNNNVKLIWSTTKETNNKGFDMERKSTTNNDWSKIGYVEGKGTTNAVTNYAFTDQKLQSGKYNYRIKQVDINGNYTYFNLNGDIEIGIPQKFDVSQNYPNPFNPVTKIDYQIPTDGFVSMKLYDMLGREVKSVFSDNQKAGYYSIKIDGSSLASGMYFCIINLNSPGKSFTKNIKLMLVK